MENKTPVLSICIPTYNSSKFLSETLDSIVPQFDNKEFFDKTEIIISDNDSPDNTFDIVKKYQKKYNNIKYFKNHTNLGWAVNVIKVTEYANWEYLWLLTDNDCSTKNTLDYFFRIVKETNFDVLIWNFADWSNWKINSFQEDYKWYNKFNNLVEFGNFFWKQKNINLHTFWSNFSLYSIFFINKKYFNYSRNLINKDKLKTHFFPHSLIVYSNIENKIIIKPNNAFTLVMGNPSSWKHTPKLFSDFKEVFTSFLWIKSLSKSFKIKCKKFLFRYYLINFIWLTTDKVPFIKIKLQRLVKKSNLFKKFVEIIIDPSI